MTPERSLPAARRSGERDFVGYGAEPPHAGWPGGARIALNFVVNVEEGSEYAVGDGDGRSEGALTEVSAARVPQGDRDLAAESMYEYGARAGFWRLARLFAARGVIPTAFAALRSRASAQARSRSTAASRIGGDGGIEGDTGSRSTVPGAVRIVDTSSWSIRGTARGAA